MFQALKQAKTTLKARAMEKGGRSKEYTSATKSYQTLSAEGKQERVAEHEGVTSESMFI